MKQWVIRILKLTTILFVLFVAIGIGFVKWTIAETSLSVLEAVYPLLEPLDDTEALLMVRSG